MRVSTMRMLCLVVGFARGFDAPCTELIAENGPETVYFFVGFDKTGSSTMQQVLRRYFPGSRYASPENRYACTETSYIFYTWGMFGAFDVSAFLGQRTIKFFTVLRDPFERLGSSYNYFCADCAEDGRQCRSVRAENEPKFEPQLFCPDMTIFEYAQAFQDVYTRAFAHADSTNDHDAPLGHQITQDDYDKALSWIHRTKPFFMFTTSFTETEPFYFLGEFLKSDVLKKITVASHSNSHAHRIAFREYEIQNISSTFLAWDLKLYRWLENKYQQPVW